MAAEPPPRMRGCQALLALVLFALPALANAGAFAVTPVRIYMGPKDRAVAVTLTNEADAPVALQAELHSWTQTADGAEQLVPTDDLILSPPILKLAAHARQVVRLAMVVPRDPVRQMTYRLIVREVPEVTAPKDSQVQVPIALVLSMPVFVTPPVARRELSCRIATAANMPPEAMCTNQGTAYAQVRLATLKRGERVLAGFEAGTYILPGASKTIALASALSAQDAGAGPAELVVTFDDGKSQIFSVRLP